MGNFRGVLQIFFSGLGEGVFTDRDRWFGDQEASAF